MAVYCLQAGNPGRPPPPEHHFLFRTVWIIKGSSPLTSCAIIRQRSLADCHDFSNVLCLEPPQILGVWRRASYPEDEEASCKVASHAMGSTWTDCGTRKRMETTGSRSAAVTQKKVRWKCIAKAQLSRSSRPLDLPLVTTLEVAWRWMYLKVDPWKFFL